MRIYADSRRYSKYAAICSGAGLLGVLIGRATWWVGAPVAIVSFGLAALLVRGAVSQPARITVDADGLGGTALPRPLAWTEIASIEHTTRPARYGTLQLLRITRREGEPVDVPLSGLLTPPATIVEAVEQFHEVAAAAAPRPDMSEV